MIENGRKSGFRPAKHITTSTFDVPPFYRDFVILVIFHTHPTRVRLYLTNTREIHLSDRCYSSMDEYLPHVPDKVFVQSTSTCPIFFAEYIRPQYEYLPNDFEKVFVQETNSSLLLLRGCSSVAREYIALSQANTSLGNRCIICVTENKCSQKSHCCSNIRTLEFEYTSFMSNLCCSWVFPRVC